MLIARWATGQEADVERLNGHENMARLEPQNVGPLPRGQIIGLSGREILDQLLKGALPMPHFGPTLRMSLVEVDKGRVVFSGEPVDAFANPFGAIHGGWIAAILDSAMGCAVHSTLKSGQIYTTTSMTIQFVRALPPSQHRVRCEGRAVHTGGRVSTAEGRLFDATGRLLAHGSETCLIMGVTKDHR
jgi:uncharacterized protein (TIGR00369 family)